MYFISSAFQEYCIDNKRSHFKNLVNEPINGREKLIRIDSLHMQKKVDVIDDEVIFIIYKGPKRDNVIQQKKYGLKGIHSLFEYSISQYDNSCVACIKILKGYYPPREFVRSFNVFSVKYLESRVIFRLGEKDVNKGRIILHIQRRTEFYSSPQLLTILGFHQQMFKNAKQASIKTVKFQNHRSIFKHKKKLLLKKIKSGMYNPNYDYNKNRYLPQVIKIYCDQVESSIESESVNKLVSVMPGFSENDCGNYDYYPINPIILKLNGAFVNSFKLKLTDESCQQLKLSTGFATYIKASLMPVDENLKMARQEYITVLSSDTPSKIMYPNNVNNSFSINLPKILQKGGYNKWYMSLLNISLPSITPNIHEGENKIIIYNEAKEQIARIIVPEGYYKDANEILDKISREMNEAGVLTDIEEIGRFSFINIGSEKKTLKISTNLALALGLVNDVTVKLMVKLELDVSDPYLSDFEPDLRITNNSYCKLICDQLSSTYFGDANEEILRFLPLTKIKKQAHYFQEFYQKIRVEINSSTLTKLSFRLTKENSTGLIQFQNKDVATHLTLLIEREN